MNKHILFVKDHLANPDKYSLQEIEENAREAKIYNDAAEYAAAASADIANNKISRFFGDAVYLVDFYCYLTGENEDDYTEEINNNE